MDIDTLEPGVDFVEELQRTVTSCDVFLAVLGRQWLAAKDEEGRARLSNPDDFVALEIGAALERRNIRVVPILVAGAAMPRSAELPEQLSGLTRRQALVLPDIGFHQTLGRLIDSIEKAEQERLAREKAEAAQRAEQERLAQEKAEAAKRAEQERLAQEKAEAAKKAEQERLAREKAEAAQRAEQERLAREKAEAAQKAEQERLAQEKAGATKWAAGKEKRKRRVLYWTAISVSPLLLVLTGIFIVTLSRKPYLSSSANSAPHSQPATKPREPITESPDPSKFTYVKSLGKSTPDYNSIHSIAFNQDASLLAAGSGDRTVRIWSFPAGELVHTFKHTDDVTSVSFSPDGAVLASCAGGSWDNTVRLWDVKTGASLGQTTILFNPTTLKFSPDGSLLAVGVYPYSDAKANRVVLLNPQTGKMIRTLNSPTAKPSEIRSLGFSPDGNILASTTYEQLIFWNTSTGELIADIKLKGGPTIETFNSSESLTLRTDHELQFLDLASKRSVRSEQIPKPCQNGFEGKGRYSHDRKWIVRASNAHTIQFCRVETGSLEVTHQRGLTQTESKFGTAYFDAADVQFSPDDHFLVVGNDHDTIDVWTDRALKKEE
jgi:WD40 repeat protein